MATFGENLKRIRKSRGLTQAELAEQMGVDRATITKYETEKNNIMINKFKLMATVLNCTVGELLGEKPQAKAEQAKQIEIIVKINGNEVMRWQNTDTE